MDNLCENDVVSRKAVCEWYCNNVCRNKECCDEPCAEYIQILDIPTVRKEEI